MKPVCTYRLLGQERGKGGWKILHSCLKSGTLPGLSARIDLGYDMLLFFSCSHFYFLLWFSFWCSHCCHNFCCFCCCYCYCYFKSILCLLLYCKKTESSVGSRHWILEHRHKVTDVLWKSYRTNLSWSFLRGSSDAVMRLLWGGNHEPAHLTRKTRLRGWADRGWRAARSDGRKIET